MELLSYAAFREARRLVYTLMLTNSGFGTNDQATDRDEIDEMRTAIEAAVMRR